MSLKFLFGIHNHQPIGNFDHVFSESYNRCYLPFIDVLEHFPMIKLSLHYTGPLFEWIERNNPLFLEKLANLVNRGQVELLGGGFYEPLLSIIPQDDAIGQILMQTEFLKKNFNFEPEGIWLAERIWDTSIPVILSKADITYTIVDDTHFFNAGMNHADMFGYYITERHGHTTALFPINKFLRYSIPFKAPEETFKHFRRVQDEFGAECIIFADDGEKFGIWPGTYNWVYKEKWLERFFSEIERNSDWVEMITFSEYLKSYPSEGRVYLPMASYEEMMEWTLPAESGEKFRAAMEWLDKAGAGEDFKPYIRGGFWDNFLVKYPESNLLHKKMLLVSKKIKTFCKDDRVRIDAVRDLYKGQCNCAYWHGLFGGLYLNYLRHAIYAHLISAEKAVDSLRHDTDGWITFEEADYDSDSRIEVLVGTPLINAYFDPDYGGSMVEMDFKPKNFNITNLLSRKKEAYHFKLEHDDSQDIELQPKSIHDIVKSKEEGLSKMLFYDKYLKACFLDHFFEKDTTIDSFHRSSYTELGDFIDSGYNYEINTKKLYLTLKRVGYVIYRGIKRKVGIIKSFGFYKDMPSISVSYEIINMELEDLDLWFGVELNFTLLAGNDPQRYYYVPGSNFGQKRLISKGEVDNTDIFCMRDDYSKFEIVLKLNNSSSLWYFPIETISQSEDGIEKNYQGSTILPHYRFNLKNRDKKRIGMIVNCTKF